VDACSNLPRRSSNEASAPAPLLVRRTAARTGSAPVAGRPVQNQPDLLRIVTLDAREIGRQDINRTVERDSEQEVGEKAETEIAAEHQAKVQQSLAVSSITSNSVSAIAAMIDRRTMKGAANQSFLSPSSSTVGSAASTMATVMMPGQSPSRTDTASRVSESDHVVTGRSHPLAAYQIADD
jgi:phage-related tail fiber protein